MIITYNGENYFKIQSGEDSILIDPTNQRAYKGTAVILNTIKPPFAEPPEGAEPFWIEHQGEYEIKGIRVVGMNGTSKSSEISEVSKASKISEKTIYKIFFDDIVIGILGGLENEPNKEIQENLKGVDIIMVPASGKPYINQASLAKFLRQIEPGIIIPAFFKKSEEVKQFSKEFGQSPKEEEKLVIKKKDTREKGMEIRVIGF